MGLFRWRGTPPRAQKAPRVVPVGPAEQRWIADHLALLQTSGIDVTDAAALSDLYDELLTDWLSAPPDQRPDANLTINLLGIGLGEHLRLRTSVLNWAIAEADTAELALHAQPGDVLIYPTNAVAKRWTARETGFIRAFAHDTANAVARITSPH